MLDEPASRLPPRAGSSRRLVLPGPEFQSSKAGLQILAPASPPFRGT